MLPTDIKTGISNFIKIISSDLSDDTPASLEKKISNLKNVFFAIAAIGIVSSIMVFIATKSFSRSLALLGLMFMLLVLLGVSALHLLYLIKSKEYYIVRGTVVRSSYERNFSLSLGNILGTKKGKGAYCILFKPDRSDSIYKITVSRGRTTINENERINVYLKPDAIDIEGEEYHYFSSIIAYQKEENQVISNA